MKKTIATILAVMLLTTAAYAAVNMRAEYEGFGYAELELSRDVIWNDPQVSAVDGEGNPADVQLIRKDEDDVKIRIPMYEDGKTYTLTLSGIEGEAPVSAELFANPEKTSLIEEIDFEATDSEGIIEVDFNFDVVYDGGFSVTITDMNGVEYPHYEIRKESDGFEVHVGKLAVFKSHIISFSGVAAKSSKAPASLGDFSASYSGKFVVAPYCCA